LTNWALTIKVAINITFPEIVNEYNIDKMRELIKNGSDNWKSPISEIAQTFRKVHGVRGKKFPDIHAEK